MQPVNSSISDGSKPDGSNDWKVNAIKNEVPILDPNDKYTHWLIPKFTPIAKGARLTPERLAKMIIGDGMTLQEKEVLTEMLYNREAVLAWDFSEMGKVKKEVAHPQKIKTIDHQAWQVPGFQIPKALTSTVIDMLQERLKMGVIEPCHGPYRNPWYLVKKTTPGKYRLVNVAVELNRVTVRDANLPPSVDEFSEKFAGCAISSLIDFFSGYDQVELDEESRDLTGFMTPLGLMRMTTLPQGATNSVAQFVRIALKVLADHLRDRAEPFLDDVGIKGPKTTYNNEELAPGIRRYVVEHIQNLDAVLADLERAGITIAGAKSQFCCAGIKIVGFICDSDGRHPDTSKVLKILDWPECINVTAARAFMGVCVYYRIWIKDFAQVAAPIYRLFKKNTAFEWGREQTEAMDLLKLALTSPPALVSLDYTEGAGDIILAVDASLDGWGGVLMQLVKGKRHPSRYESGIWSNAERNYDATKRECRGVLKALKKVRYWLYGVKFILETDANVLVAQLNRSGTDLPGALVTRWIAWIQLFDFEVRHIPGRKHTAADGLSRRPHTKADLAEAEAEPDIDEFILAELNCLRVSPISVDEPIPILQEGYTELSRKIATYLTTLRRPADMTIKEFNAFKKRALKFKVQDNHLFRRNSKNVPMRRVVDNLVERQNILQQLHDESGHKGREGTYRRVADRYWWENLHSEVKAYVQSCQECQRRDPSRPEEALHPTWVALLWQKVGLDVVYMPPCEGFRYLVVARCDLSGWVEAKPLRTLSSKAVAEFLWEDVICRHGCFGKLVIDGGSENKEAVAELTRRYGIKRVMVSAYHPQANGMIERGHKPIVDALSKMSDEGSNNWVRNLPAVLWADRSTVRTSTGLTPYYISCGNEPVLPIELEIPTWRILPWGDIHTTSDLLAMRARQLQRRDQDLEEAVLHLQRMRLEGKERHDEKHGIRNEELAIGSIVLLHDTRREKDMSQKLAFKWLGPYRIHDAVKEKGTYLLEELDGSRLAGTFAGDRLKKFHPRQQLRLDRAPDLDQEVVPTLENFLADDSDLSDVPDDVFDL